MSTTRCTTQFLFNLLYSDSLYRKPRDKAVKWELAVLGLLIPPFAFTYNENIVRFIYSRRNVRGKIARLRVKIAGCFITRGIFVWWHSFDRKVNVIKGIIPVYGRSEQCECEWICLCLVSLSCWFVKILFCLQRNFCVRSFELIT